MIGLVAVDKCSTFVCTSFRLSGCGVYHCLHTNFLPYKFAYFWTRFLHFSNALFRVSPESGIDFRNLDFFVWHADTARCGRFIKRPMTLNKFGTSCSSALFLRAGVLYGILVLMNSVQCLLNVYM